MQLQSLFMTRRGRIAELQTDLVFVRSRGSVHCIFFAVLCLVLCCSVTRFSLIRTPGAAPGVISSQSQVSKMRDMSVHKGIVYDGVCQLMVYNSIVLSKYLMSRCSICSIQLKCVRHVVSYRISVHCEARQEDSANILFLVLFTTCDTSNLTVMSFRILTTQLVVLLPITFSR